MLTGTSLEPRLRASMSAASSKVLPQRAASTVTENRLLFASSRAMWGASSPIKLISPERLTTQATASVAGLRGLEGTNGYSASKAYMINAMEGYRRAARHGGFPCRYVTLLPGFVDTAMGQASAFWRCSTREAAFCILKVLERGRCVAYVTPRWRWIGVLMRLMPRALFERIPLA